MVRMARQFGADSGLRGGRLIRSSVPNDVVRERLRQLAHQWSRCARLARAAGASEYDAKDIATDAMIKVARSPSFDEAVADHWPYLAVAVRRQLIDHYRRLCREGEAWSHVHPVVTGPAPAESPGPWPRPAPPRSAARPGPPPDAAHPDTCPHS
jgi:DNA-directed RNA polymerase specialized sigma24 family protein